MKLIFDFCFVFLIFYILFLISTKNNKVKNSFSSIMFLVAGAAFMLLSALQYFAGYPHPTALLTLGIAFIVIGYAIRSKYKKENKGEKIE